jgi:hypothetical protein
LWYILQIKLSKGAFVICRVFAEEVEGGGNFHFCGVARQKINEDVKYVGL